MRTGAVEILAGYDGEYGTIRIFSSTERERLKGQHALFALPATGPSTAQHVAPATSVPSAVRQWRSHRHALSLVCSTRRSGKR